MESFWTCDLLSLCMLINFVRYFYYYFFLRFLFLSDQWGLLMGLLFRAEHGSISPLPSFVSSLPPRIPNCIQRIDARKHNDSVAYGLSCTQEIGGQGENAPRTRQRHTYNV